MANISPEERGEDTALIKIGHIPKVSMAKYYILAALASIGTTNEALG